MHIQTSINVLEKDFHILGYANDPYMHQLETIGQSLSPIFELLQQRLKINSVIFDIGANVGISSFGFSSIVKSGKVYSFEPSSKLFGCLTHNLKINNLDNVIPINAAISDYCGVLDFHTSDYGAGSHVVTLDHSLDKNILALASVPCMTVDDFVAKNDIDRVDFIKIDIVGHEPKALQGAKNTINHLKPFLIIEFNSWCLSGLNNYHAYSFLISLLDDFEVFRIDGCNLQLLSKSNALEFLHLNFTQRGFVDDLLLVPKAS